MKSALIVEDIAETSQWLADIVRAAFVDCRIDKAANVGQGIRAMRLHDYDLALIDIGLPDGSGLEVLQQFSLQSPQTTCVITTVMGDDTHVIAALSAGAQGYLLKEQSADLLCRQLTQMTMGMPALSPSIARRIMQHFRLTAPRVGAEHALSTREQEVLSLISTGLRNRDVANTLGVAESTVASHIKVIYRKLGISSRAEAASYATRMGLVKREPIP